MFPLHLFGFGASDILELVLAALLVASALLWRPWIEPYAARLATRTGWCMLLLAALPVALRLLLLPHHPVPSPDIYDEFCHLLVADTLRHFRLANPMHPLHQFFETFFVLQEPTYSSIYPIGQGLLLAFGWTIFGLPWAGVVISAAALCALSYWMLRAWTTPGWALAGGFLAVMEFGPLNQWMNDYWGGALPAAAGCLVFGALPRLRRADGGLPGVLLGAGVAIYLLTRPYESIFLVLSIILFFVPVMRNREELRAIAKPALVAILVVIPAIGIILLQNKEVTGKWTTLPYRLSQYQYGVPAPLTFEKTLVPHRELTHEQELDYQMQSAFRGGHAETVQSYLARLEYRARFYRFFFLAPLYLVLPAFLMTLGRFKYWWVLVTVLLLALGINFFPAFQFHYMSGVTCLFILISVTGLQQLSRMSMKAAQVVYFLCIVQFLVWYSAHLFENDEWSLAIRQYETWQTVNHQNPERRIEVNHRLAQIPGKLLVFVRYWPRHIFQDEWVYNRADIDGARVVWARDLGAAENEKLRHYYPGRSVWLLEPDARPPKLTPY